MSNVIELEVSKKSLSQDELKAFLTSNLRELRRFAYSLTKDMHDADDLLQTVIERLLKKSIPVDVQARAWVFRVCKNAWIDELRARNVRQGSAQQDETDIEDNSEISKPSSQINQVDLQKAIDDLAEPYRDVIKLIIVAGLSYAEASETLDVPIGTIMSRVARARQQLKERLGNDGGT